MSESFAQAPRLSLAMVVRNAAAELRQTLGSVQELASQIVVLDTGSTDETLRVAEELGAVTCRRPWDDDFAAARNACLERCQGDWVLWLDAGEVLPAESAAALRRVLEEPVESPRAYLLPVVLPPVAGQIGGEQICRVRLHPRHVGVKFSGRVRERLDESLGAAGIELHLLQAPICRTARDHEAAVRGARAQRNIRLADLTIAESGPSAEMENCLGESLQMLGDPLRAARHFRQALKLAEPGSRDALEAYFGLLTCLAGAGSDRNAQFGLCMEALESFPLDAHLLVAVGGYLQALGQLPLAIRAYDIAFRHGQTEVRLWHLTGIREIAAVCAAAGYQQAGENAQARTLLEAAICTYPGSQRLARQLAELHAKRGRHSEAVNVFAMLPADPDGRKAGEIIATRADRPVENVAPPVRLSGSTKNLAAPPGLPNPEN